MRLLFLFILLDINWVKECYVCHSFKRFPLKNSSKIIENWLSSGKQIEQKGHIWIPKERFSDSDYSAINKAPDRLNFYGTLSLLTNSIALDGGSKNDLKLLKKLINQGSQEVPVYAKYWSEALKMLDASPFKRKRWIKRFQTSLERPFLYLYLHNGFKYDFKAESKLDVKKVLFFFGGFKRTNKIDFSFKVHNFDGQNYRGHFEGKHYLKTIQNWTADFYMDTFGDLKRLKPNDSILTPTMLNMASFMARGTLKDLNQPTGKKIIFIDRNRALKKNKLELKMTMQLGEVIRRGSVPLLSVDYTLSEYGADRGDSFNLSGNGRVFLSPDGLMQEMNSKVRFQLKLFKIGLINGYSHDHISLNKISAYEE